MNTHIHIATGILGAILLAVVGFAPFQYPLTLFIMLVFAVLPDVDFVAGPQYHRKKTHTILAGFIAAILLAVGVSAVSELFAPIAAGVTFVIVSGLHFLHYYRTGEHSDAARRTCYSWYYRILLITVWFTIDFGIVGYTLKVPPPEYVFFAAFLGYILHLMVDLLNSGGDSSLSLLWPISEKRFGTSRNIITIGTIEETYLFTGLCASIVFLTTEFGRYTSWFFAQFPEGYSWTFRVVVVVLVAFWSFVRLKPEPQKIEKAGS